MATKIFIIRHGESKQNIDNSLSGVTDVPLSANGREQCRFLSLYFKNIPIDKVFTSPLQRAQQSAEIIFPRGSSSIQVVDSLIELNYGDYEGYHRSQYVSSHDDVIKQWITNPSNLTFPGGDNVKEHSRTTFDGLKELANENPESVIACISHRTTIRLIVAEIIGLHLDKFRSLPCSNCGVTEVSFDGKWHLHSLNLTFLRFVL